MSVPVFSDRIDTAKVRQSYKLTTTESDLIMATTMDSLYVY